MTQENTALTVQNADPTLSIFQSAGLDATDFAGAETIATGGVTKWIDLRSFQEDVNAPQNKAVRGNGGAFAGVLMGRHEIEVDDSESGELRPDGVKVRYFYSLRLVASCQVTAKEDGESKVETAAPGEIVAIGERHSLKILRQLAEDGGLYIVVIRPHSRVKIGNGRTMWTFDVAKKTLRPPMLVKAELVKAPF